MMKLTVWMVAMAGLVLCGCSTHKLRLSGSPGIVLLTEVSTDGTIVDQRMMVPGEVESTRVKAWEVRRPERTDPLVVDILKGRRVVLHKVIPPGIIGFSATRETEWTLDLMRPSGRPGGERLRPFR